MVATEIRLDLNGKKGPDLWARLGESDTRQIVMHPGYFDPEGNWTPLIIDAENIFAKFRIVKPDNTFVIIDASLYLPSDPSIFVVTLPETATQVAGLGYYDLRIGDGETPDTFLYSAGGRFIVDDDMITDEMIASVASVNGLIFPDDFLTRDNFDPEDYYTKSETDTAIADAISLIPDPMDRYSTEEKIVGTWIDGTTPVYERTFYFDTLTRVNDWATFDTTTVLSRLLYYNVSMILQNNQQGGIVLRVAYNPPVSPNTLCYYYDGYSYDIKNVYITIRYIKPII